MTTGVTVSLVVLFTLLIMGVPIGLVFFATAVTACLIGDYNLDFLIMNGAMKIRAIVLLGIPLFIFAGGLMAEGGISERFINLANALVGRFKASLGVVAAVASCMFGAVTGSQGSTAAAIGGLMIPKMIKSGHKPNYTASLIAAASPLGNLIPPSVPMIIYGWSSGASIAACFLAAALPGIMLTFMLSLVHIITVRKDPNIASAPPLPFIETTKNIARATWKATFAIGMAVIILGGIYSGIFTPTEAAAVSVIYAILVGFVVYRTLKVKNFFRIAFSTATTSGQIMFILFAILIMSRVYTTEHVPAMLADALLGVSSNKYVILAMVNVMLVIIGMLMDMLSAVVVTTPMLLPLVIQLGMHPVQFGAMLVTNMAMGYLTPPVAGGLFITQGMTGVELRTMFPSAYKFAFFAYLPVIIVVTYWSPLSLFLPKLFMGI